MSVRRLAAAAAAAVAALGLVACTKTETVAARGADGGHQWVQVRTVVSDHGKVERDKVGGKQAVSAAEYAACRPGTRWPDCKDAAAGVSVTISAVPTTPTSAQRIMDSGAQCTAVQFTDVDGARYVLGHGLNRIKACGNRAARWYGLPRRAVIRIRNGPFAGRYQVTGHTTTHDRETSPPPPGANRHDLVLGSCMTDLTTGWTFAHRMKEA